MVHVVDPDCAALHPGYSLRTVTGVDSPCEAMPGTELQRCTEKESVGALARLAIELLD